MSEGKTSISVTLKKRPNPLVVWGNWLVLLALVLIFSFLNWIPVEQKEQAAFQVMSLEKDTASGTAFKLGILVNGNVTFSRLAGKDVALQWEDFRTAADKNIDCRVDSVGPAPYRRTWLRVVPVGKYREQDALQVGTTGVITISSRRTTYFSILRDKL